MSIGSSADPASEVKSEDAVDRPVEAVTEDAQAAPPAAEVPATQAETAPPAAEVPATEVETAPDERPAGTDAGEEAPVAPAPVTPDVTPDPGEEAPPAAGAPAEPEALAQAFDAPATAEPAAETADAMPVTAEQPAPEAAGTARRPGRPDAQQRRRRRPNAAERHRRVFFAKLSELRRADQQPEAPADTAVAAATTAAPESGEAVAAVPETGGQPDGPAVTAPEAGADSTTQSAPAEPAAAEAPAAEPAAAPATAEPATAEPATAEPAPAEPAAADAAPVASGSEPGRASKPARAQARLAAAIERVGGAPVILEALTPKHDDQGQQLKWAAVCCQASQGLPPGDPTFAAWLRLAVTPVREIKAQVSDGSSRQGGRRDDRGRQGGDRRPRSGGRPDSRGPRPSSGDLAAHGRDGSFKSKVRIIGDLSSITG